ncbi:hypothetical protein WG899_19115 [Paucibacter sp. AS339]|uniref:hypothetical protein n=1 Tax=Paucibacter hankyongi TaxID=3133434 RepID=UPI0030B26BE7
MNSIKLSMTAALLAGLSLAQAAGPLLTTDHPRNPQPLRWDTSKGPVQVYTDIGVYTYKDDGSVFLSNAQADKITAFALKQWSDVQTSTWKAVTDPKQFKKFSEVPSIGIDVVDGETAQRVYGQYNEGGMYVIYDQHGQVIEEIFGAPKDQVLGIAFAEIAEDRDGDGFPETIVKATAVMNGYIVSHEAADPDNGVPPPDLDGKRIAGVFTHEFGHAINLSHSQVNGQLGYFSSPGYGQDLYPGVAGCVAPVHSWRNPEPTANRLDPKYIETMFPFINPTTLDAHGHNPGLEQSTVDRPDDIAAISDLYPTPSYAKSRGAIAGVLYLKDGRTPYGGINIIARNVNDPLGDAISAMSGDKTQGKIGPDGRFRINNLTPGQKYVLYLEEIVAGGYPTTPTALVSEAEYWSVNEQSNAAKDKACTRSAITAEAGVTKTANFYFNGYKDGVQYTPVTYGFLGSMSKDGERAAGIIDNKPFVWDAKKGVEMAPTGVLGTNASITRDGRSLIVQTDQNGVVAGFDPFSGAALTSNSAGIWDTRTARVVDLRSLNGNTCFGGSQIGYSSSYGWALDGKGRTAVGTAFIDRDGDGACEGNWSESGGFLGNEIVPFIWTAAGGMRQLSLDGVDTSKQPWYRAHAISANGRVVLGTSNLEQAWAWIDEGRPIDLFKAIGAVDGGYAMTPDASRVVLHSRADGLVFWNANKGTHPGAFTKIRKLQWCKDLPFLDFGLSCDSYEGGAEAIERDFGPIPVVANDISDDGRVMIARAGTFWESGMHGMLWLEDLGWIKLTDFFRTQGVAEAYRFGLDGPASLNGRGTELVGGIPGYPLTWYVDMKKAFVCRHGNSVETAFPHEFVDQVKKGARMGRCEHQPKQTQG